jgi:outer membrane protein OmpA-like peptidoglycan-associated protein
MLIYRRPTGGQARALRLLGAVVLTASYLSVAQAQDRRYLFEVGAAAARQSFGDSTELKGALAGVGRVGVWLPLNFSVEAEGAIATAKTKSSDESVKVKWGGVSVLYNLLIGSRGWLYGKLGYGGTKYGPGGAECLTFGAKICGSTNTYIVGVGFRYPISPLLLARSEIVIHPNKGTTIDNSTDPPTQREVKFTNWGLNLGLSVMLGSKPIPDSDHDGIPNNRDRCADTPEGAQVDGSGCPADNDNDGVPNGVDRCPNTAVGATVDASGCPRDSDGDNIPDGVDKCPDTPPGVLVDANGCPKDSDKDGIPDGMDRCSDTPQGATVDALGCPGDEDSDGVLDGLDRCPRTPIGATVNAQGCVAGQTPSRSAAPQRSQPPPTAANPPPVDTAPAVPRQPPAPRNDLARAGPTVLEGVTFESGSARLQPGSYVELDSIARVLIANPNLRVEIGGHTDDSGTPADNMRISSLRADAVRNYLLAKGVQFRQVQARGYGSTMPRTPDTTPRGRALNRRVEVRVLPPGS